MHVGVKKHIYNKNTTTQLSLSPPPTSQCCAHTPCLNKCMHVTCVCVVDHIRWYSLQSIGVDVCKGQCMAGCVSASINCQILLSFLHLNFNYFSMSNHRYLWSNHPHSEFTFTHNLNNLVQSSGFE